MKTKLLIIPAAAAMLALAACQSEDLETEETVEDTSAAPVEEADVAEDEPEVEEEEEAPNPYNEYDQEVGIYPENDADVEGSDDVDAANRIARDMALNDMASRLKAYERLIRPLDTDEHEPFNAKTAYEAIELTEKENYIWSAAGVAYIEAHHPELHPIDDRDEIREILRDPEQGAFRIATANSAINRVPIE